MMISMKNRFLFIIVPFLLFVSIALFSSPVSAVYCGDSSCDPGENSCSCPTDCEGTCEGVKKLACESCDDPDYCYSYYSSGNDCYYGISCSSTHHGWECLSSTSNTRPATPYLECGGDDGYVKIDDTKDGCDSQCQVYICKSSGWGCQNIPDGTSCTYEGNASTCADGVCQAIIPEEECEKGVNCFDQCRPGTGNCAVNTYECSGSSCVYSMSFYSCSEDTICSGGECVSSPGSCEGGGGGDEPCTPATCDSLGYTCGTWDDGCGGTIDCGNCPAPTTTYSSDYCLDGDVVRDKNVTSYSCPSGSCVASSAVTTETVTTCTGEYTCVGSVCADVVSPSVSVSGAPGAWQSSNASASVSCSDAGSGCNSGTYRLKTYSSNPGSCSNNYADYTLSNPSAISSHVWVCAAAKDNAGNAGFSSAIEFKVDKIAPTGSLTGVPAVWQTADASISLSCSDTGGSGCNSNNDYYYIDSDSSCPSFSTTTYTAYTSTVTVNAHKWFCYSVADNAGNRFTSTTGTEIKVDNIPPTVSVTGLPFSPCVLDPTVEWIDCSAMAVVSCADSGSGCNSDTYGYIVYDSNPGICPASKTSYTSSGAVAISEHEWVCSYAEDNVGLSNVSAPTEFKIDRTFTFKINIYAYDDKGIKVTNTDVNIYLCTIDKYYCNKDVEYITKTSAITDASGHFTAFLSAKLDRGNGYKVGVETEKGYAESKFIA